MKLSRALLCDYIDLPLSEVGDRSFAEAMTMSGSKVEATEILSDRITGVVVGRITGMEKHPDSDHMWVCTADVGEGRDLSIVTGAQNQKIGDLVAVAKDGAKLHGGLEIKKAPLRGIISEGMFCSFSELGQSLHEHPYADPDGILILNEEFNLGEDICSVIGLDDHVVEFEITPNRSDCLSVIGLAREAAVTFNKPLKLHTPLLRSEGGNAADLVDITIDDPTLCPRYTARVVKNVKIAPSPRWLREKLSASGIRPINNIVDITNFVMLEYGQPMHAFDLACVKDGQIIVRRAKEGEVLKTLDGTERNLRTGMLCICDSERPIAVGGVMGGENSEIIGDTAAVLFESANFDGTSIRRTAAALNMRTDASSRFEKGIDPNLTEIALNRACELVQMLSAGEVLDGTIDVYPEPKPELIIPFVPEKINAILGSDISSEFMCDALSRLGFIIDGSNAKVPSWRLDISPLHPHNDLAEEVARIYGYDRIKSSAKRRESAVRGGLSDVQSAEKLLGTVCRSCGYSEIITYSFISPSSFDKIRLSEESKLRDCVRILNPLGEDTSCMRSSTLPSMLETLARNRSYRNLNVRLYDFGRIYKKRDDGLADEKQILTLGAYGDTDFYSLKGAVQALCSALRISDLRYVAVSDNPSYHPGRAAKVYKDDALIAVLGQIHPLVAANYGVSDAMYAAEIDFEAMLGTRGNEPLYVPLPAYPAILRDIAVICPEDKTAYELVSCIKASGGTLLESCSIFDCYKGTGIPEGFKSMAFSLKLRAKDRTLKDSDADDCVNAVLKALAALHDAHLR